jgi:hypothetical protein
MGGGTSRNQNNNPELARYKLVKEKLEELERVVYQRKRFLMEMRRGIRPSPGQVQQNRNAFYTLAGQIQQLGGKVKREYSRLF